MNRKGGYWMTTGATIGRLHRGVKTLSKRTKVGIKKEI